MPLGSRAEQGQSSTAKPFPDYPSPEGCFWLRQRLRERSASGFNLTPRGSCHHGFAVRGKDAFTQPRAKAADLETPGHSKASMSWATLGSSPGPEGEAGAITPCHCSQGGHSEHRSPGTWHWGAHTSLSAGSAGDPQQHPGLWALCRARHCKPPGAAGRTQSALQPRVCAPLASSLLTKNTGNHKNHKNASCPQHGARLSEGQGALPEDRPHHSPRPGSWRAASLWKQLSHKSKH